MVAAEQLRKCLHCKRRLKQNKRKGAKYCTSNCQRSAAEARRKARIKATTLGIAPKIEPDAKSWLNETLADELEATGYFDKIRDGTLTMVDVQHMLNVQAQSQVSRAYAEVERRKLERLAQGGWSRSIRTTYLLAFDITKPDLLETEAAWEWAEQATVRFLEFEANYFTLPNGEPWIREEFHRTWIKEILFAIATGGYLQILSPPRHGKTELLTHFAVWLICRDPNIRILWMGPNDEKAKEVIAKVKEILEFNEALIEDTLPPGVTYAPMRRSGAVWQQSKFKVANRRTGIAGNTMLGVGRGAKILSLNADMIIGDDIEDHDSTMGEGDRKKTRRWYGTQLDSRKEEHTPMFLIGSRQHPDDLYSYNIVDPNYRVVINSAHDKACRKPETPHADHQDCMLFPKLRSHRWLMSKKHGSDTRSDDDETGIFEMVYLNDPDEIDFAVFYPSLIEPSFNGARRLGLDLIPTKGRRTVAGLDPSATGYQAGWLWAVTPIDGVTGTRDELQDRRFKRWMVNGDNKLGGGVEAFLELADLWLKLYDCRYWVVEDNAFQAMYLNDPRTKSWARANDVHIEGHTTGTNKYDRVYGISAQKRLFIDELVDLPYGDVESRRLVDLYAKQMYNHIDAPATATRKQKTDLKMAAWFPTKTIRRWEKEAGAEADRQRQRTDNPYPASYPGISGFTHQSTPPWSRN